ncbi:beta/gamma crystallin-related protein [Nitrospirillum sp. BR 11164]|uniref:beta/gamma crystallin-related protein n=1 Tax=Nitrospirillum sp. BR 11164 TaxID=3104324 RepID=UPI002AFEAB4A|nr:beta/gamma crystallin-related protein [Nitrospirillum sp. BR 11164]MEA1651376.1 beta/gamma crystallin-related protein [Nitrospirillum sp. BR 11164]
MKRVLSLGLLLAWTLSAMAIPWQASAANGEITLYKEPGLKGDTLVITDDTDNLAYTRWNDRARSLYVESGTWEVCRQAGYHDCVTVHAYERFDDLQRIGLDRAISSLRQVEEGRP